MVKKTKREALQTKRALIDSAIIMFRKKGYSDTTLEDIASNAGLTRGALYWHFKGKAEIFRYIYEGLTKKLDEIMSRTIDDENATLNSVADYLKESFNMLKKDFDVMITLELLILKTELSGELKSVAERDKKYVCTQVDKISSLIEKHIKANNINSDLDSREAALSIMVMHRGLALIYITNRHIIPHDESYIRIIDSFVQNIVTQNNK